MYFSHVEFMPENGFSDTKVVTSLVASLDWKHVSFTFAVLNSYCGREAEERWGSGGLPPETVLRTMPSRTSESALLEHRVKVAIIIDLCTQNENRSVNLEMKTNKIR